MASLQLRCDETLGDGVRRVASEQVSDAMAQLRAATVSTADEAVHEARKRCKRVRAVLRLARPALGEVYETENAAYRVAAGVLAQARDADVLVETLDGLVGHDAEGCGEHDVGGVADQRMHGDGATSEGVAALRGELVRRRDREQADLDKRCAEAAETLEAAGARIDRWPVDDVTWDELGKGLARVYRQGRKRGRRAYAEPSDEHFHDWRKRVKDVWHHLQLLEPSWPAVLSPTADEAHRLSNVLGDEHDLGVLRATALATQASADCAPEALVGLIDRRRAQLRQTAAPLAERLFAETPDKFAERLGAYYAAWRAEPG
jgi:CHAD domain-containing protein